MSLFQSNAWKVVRDALDLHLFTLGARPVTPLTILTVVAVMFVAYRLSALLQGRIAHLLRQRGLANDGAIAAGTRIGHYTILAVGAAVALQTAGIDVSALFAAGAVFALGVGLAVQDLAQNFVSGVILIAEGSIRPGVVLRLDGDPVEVIEMGSRSTRVRTLDDDELIVPNSSLVSSSVHRMATPGVGTRVRIDVGVHYDSDLDTVQRVLLDAATRLPGRATLRDPVVLLKGFGASSVDYEVSVWTEQPLGVPRVASALRRAVWDALRDARITIAYPQVDVHVDRTLLEAMSRGAA